MADVPRCLAVGGRREAARRVIPGLSRLLRPLRRRRGARLVVLPFRPASSTADGGTDPRAEIFGAGLAEELIELLGRDTTVDVVGPCSSRALSTRSPTARRAAEELGVSLVLRGTVQRGDGELAVEATLETAPEGAEIWSERWQQRPEDVFVIVGEIAARIRGAVAPERTTPIGTLLHREPTSDLVAWDLYVEGRALLAHPEPASLRGAVTAFEAALEHDELFAWALAGIAEAYRTAHERHLSLGREEPLPAARRGAERALELDDALPGALVSLAYAELNDWSMDVAEEHLRRALILAPGHAPAHRLLARVLMLRGDLEGAVEEAERALTLEPASDTVLNESGMPYALGGRPDVAIERSRRVVHRDPEHVMAYFHLGRYAEQLGRHGEAVTYYRAAAELSGRVPYLTAFLGIVLARAGDRHEAEEIAADVERKAGRGSPVATCLGVLLLRLGRVDEGVRWLEAALAAREMQLLLLDTPLLPLPEPRGHPRIRALLEALPRA